MNPNNHDPNVYDPQLNTAVGASEYLDQIAPKQSSGKFLDKKMMVIFGILAVIILVVIMIVASSQPKNQTDIFTTITKAKTQYDNAMSIIKYGVSNLDSGPIARNNAIASLVMGTHTAELSAKVGKNKLTKEESATLRDVKTSLAELKTAKDAGRLNSEFQSAFDIYAEDLINTLTIIKNADTSQQNKDMAKKYIDEIDILRARIEGRAGY